MQQKLFSFLNDIWTALFTLGNMEQRLFVGLKLRFRLMVNEKYNLFGVWL